MIIESEAEKRKQRILAKLKEFRLFDDEFLSKCFDGDLPCMQLILRIILEKPDLKVTECRTQVAAGNLVGRSVRFDVLATDSSGKMYNIEVQRSDEGASRKRARYNSSMLDAMFSEKSEKFDDLPETYVIFITEHDVIGNAKPVYKVERCFTDTCEKFCDGSHIVYVNGEYKGDSAIGKLMHDFWCKDPNQMYYKELANRTKFFKESEEGVQIMSKVMEELFMEGKQEGIQEGMQEGIQEGMQEGKRKLACQLLQMNATSPEDIAIALGISLEEVKRLTKKQTSVEESKPTSGNLNSF